MPWDHVGAWENGLRSLVYLEKLLLRSSYCLKEEASKENGLIRTWLIDPPPYLREVVIWTKALVNETFNTGVQCLVWWRRKEMTGWWHWWKAFEQVGVIDVIDFM